jgi:hypothetical protein
LYQDFIWISIAPSSVLSFEIFTQIIIMQSGLA